MWATAWSPPPMQHADEREEAARGVGVELDLALEPRPQRLRPLVVDGAAPHVDRLDAARRTDADCLPVAVADQEIVLHDPAERRQREGVQHQRIAVIRAYIEDKPPLRQG